ncbi:hypothetical protein AMECASPLE_026157 [Ameca splendens]|uniref:Uncharacterized protein n=1 Tax=Ameca splendens TaxID=208324 RepID=A0ABV0YT87_9TELE
MNERTQHEQKTLPASKQTYQKPWKKRQLAQPLEGRIIRSSDHKRSRGSQQQAARGTRNKQTQVNTCIHQPAHEKKEGTGLPVSCDYIDPHDPPTALLEEREHTSRFGCIFPQAPRDLHHHVLPWSAPLSPHLILHF